MRWSARWAVVILCGCAQGKSEKPAPAPAQVVARVGDRVFTLQDVEASLQAQPDFMRARYTSPERKREFVDSMVRTELLVQEARRQALDQRPEVQSVLERLLVQQLVSEANKGKEPGEEAARAYYDAHPEEFSRPERVQVSVIEFGGSAVAAPPSKAEVEKELAKLARVKDSERRAAFSALVLARSTHEASRSQDGDLGPRTRAELAQQFSAQVADAVFALQAPGQLSPPIEAPRGLVVARLIARQPGELRAFEDERARIIAKLTAEGRAKQLDSLVATLKEKTKISVDDAMVSKVDPRAPAGALLPP